MPTPSAATFAVRKNSSLSGFLATSNTRLYCANVSFIACGDSFANILIKSPRIKSIATEDYLKGFTSLNKINPENLADFFFLLFCERLH